jgi:hypothetical protein
MAIPNRQIGWSQESNLLWEITKQMDKLTKVVSASATAPYKVYTALLTQSGGDGPDNITSGNTVIGVTYQIDGSIAGDDFRNIGGPLITYNNEFQDYFFVATGTTPTNWTNGTSLNFNTGAPVVIVLENTIGNVWFTYSGDGNYGVKSDGLFIVLKSTMIISNVTWDGGSGIIKSGFDSAYDGFVITALVNGDPINNGSLFNTPIEIRVYN